MIGVQNWPDLAVIEKKENQMSNTVAPPMKAWVYHTEWITLMVMVLTCFVFVFHETVHTNERLDAHMEAINRRVDDMNRRSDDLHKEFYDLLKEMRK